jgi:uncharacterized delta-60 repeat protein
MVALLWLVASALAAALPGAPGTLDATFGSGGKVITPIGSSGDTATSLAIQPDGKIIAAGFCFIGSNNDFCLARYLANGALDTSFNSTGKVTSEIGSSQDYGNSVALQADGKIVVAGQCVNGASTAFCLARYLADGSLDTSFNVNGKVITSIGSSGDSARSLALQPDGKIVVAGRCSNGINYDFCLARYDANGALDLSFNTTGKVITSIGNSGASVQSLALQPDGKILVAGECANATDLDFCLARYLTDGTLDSSFGTSGRVITPIGGGDDRANSLALRPDGKIVVAGECSNATDFDFCLARYLANGSLDSSFGTSGKVITPIGGGDDRANSLALQSDGKIIVAGFCNTGSNFDFCLARYFANGALDTYFNDTGKVTTPIGSSTDGAKTVALQADGKIVAAGFCDNGVSYEFCLARYEGGPFDAKNCSLDIDGDNRVLATTDSLIHTRIALGLTGNAVIGGITFAPNATRNTWPLIRDYLVTQCGMSLPQ